MLLLPVLFDVLHPVGDRIKVVCLNGNDVQTFPLKLMRGIKFRYVLPCI